jgi:hypothetical protein
MASEAQNTIAPECPRNDRKTHGDGFGIPISVVFRDFETFFNKFLEPVIDLASHRISLGVISDGLFLEAQALIRSFDSLGNLRRV